MPYIKEITTIINTELQSTTLSDKRFDKGSFYSLARLIRRQEDGDRVTIPNIITNDGVCTPLTITDSKPFILYHRTLDLSYAKGDAYGNNQLIQETAKMRAVAYGNRRILKVEPELLIAAIQAGFLQELSFTDRGTYRLQKCNINITDINIDSEKVYSEEYSGDVEYRLKPNEMMVYIDYTIISEYDKECVDIC